MTAPRNRTDTPGSVAPISASLRAAIAARGVTAYRLAKSAGIHERNIRRWLNGESDLTLASVDRLAVALGLRLAEGPARKGGRREASAPVPMPMALPDVAPELTAEEREFVDNRKLVPAELRPLPSLLIEPFPSPANPLRVGSEEPMGLLTPIDPPGAA